MGGFTCIFDCETVPDTQALREVFGYTGSDIEVAKRAFSEQKEATGSEFLPVCFHKIVAISAVMADEYGRFLRVNTLGGDGEKDKLEKFLSFINTKNPRLISFNGRGFDLPMMMVRAMKYNLSAPAYFDTSDAINGKDRWKNYRSRYDGAFHLDLLDHISDFRAVSGLKLDFLCTALGLPGKYDVAGDQVCDLYFAGEVDKISEYCESDVLNTYWLFLKYELLRGNLRIEDYADYLFLMSQFLQNERPLMGYTPVFCGAIEKELDQFCKNEVVDIDNIAGLQKGTAGLKTKPKNAASDSAKPPQNTAASEPKPEPEPSSEAESEKLPEINIDEL